MSCETCQFCEKVNGFSGRNQQREPLKYDGKVKYGVRHYAHFECFLNHKGPEGYKALHGWQQKQFPYKLVLQWNLSNLIKETA